jgi:nucleotide-binding universal stress UspA family protein
MFEHILIATDGSELADKAVEQSIMLAKALGAKVTVVMVTESWDALSSLVSVSKRRIAVKIRSFLHVS